MIDIAPRHDCQNNPESQTLVAFRVHRKRVDASEGKGGQPSDAPSLGLRYVGAEGMPGSPSALRTSAGPQLFHAYRIATGCGTSVLKTRITPSPSPAVSPVVPLAALSAVTGSLKRPVLPPCTAQSCPWRCCSNHREAPIHFPLYCIFVYQFSSRKEPIMSALPEKRTHAQSHDESDIYGDVKALKAFLSSLELSEKRGLRKKQ